MKQLTKSKYNKIFFGTAGGIGEYFNIDPTWIRLLWLILFFAFGFGVIAYLGASLIIPNPNEEDEDY